MEEGMKERERPGVTKEVAVEEVVERAPAQESQEAQIVEEVVAPTKEKLGYRPIFRSGNGKLAAHDPELGGVIIFGSNEEKMASREVEYSQKHPGDYELHFPETKVEEPRELVEDGALEQRVESAAADRERFLQRVNDQAMADINAALGNTKAKESAAADRDESILDIARDSLTAIAEDADPGMVDVLKAEEGGATVALLEEEEETGAKYCQDKTMRCQASVIGKPYSSKARFCGRCHGGLGKEKASFDEEDLEKLRTEVRSNKVKEIDLLYGLSDDFNETLTQSRNWSSARMKEELKRETIFEDDDGTLNIRAAREVDKVFDRYKDLEEALGIGERKSAIGIVAGDAWKVLGKSGKVLGKSGKVLGKVSRAVTYLTVGNLSARFQLGLEGLVGKKWYDANKATKTSAYAVAPIVNISLISMGLYSIVTNFAPNGSVAQEHPLATSLGVGSFIGGICSIIEGAKRVSSISSGKGPTGSLLGKLISLPFEGVLLGYDRAKVYVNSVGKRSRG